MPSSACKKKPLTNGAIHSGCIDFGDLDLLSFFFFFNDTATTEIYTLSLHDALPIWIRLYGPNGVLLGTSGSSGAANEVSIRATNSGTFTVVATDASTFLVEIGRAHV